MHAIKILKANHFLSLNTKSCFHKFYDSGVLAINNKIKNVNYFSTTASNLSTTTDDNNLLFPEKKHNRNLQADKISKAMVYYLEKLTEREELMKVKTDEYEIGKRHLAKMMGEDPETFDQERIDKAIQYLLPSGLFDPKARPFLKDPKTYFPKSRISMFNENGRPLSHLFYTGQSDLYQLTYDITQKLLNLKKTEDAIYLITDKLHGHGNNQSATKIDLTGTVWLDKEALSSRLSRNINENEFNKFMTLLKKLADHPLAMREEPFIKEFLCPFVPPIIMSDIILPEVGEDGRKFVKIRSKLRTATCELKMIEGTGTIEISSPEGSFHIDYFETLTHRQQILFPFKVVDRVNRFDLEIKLNLGGMSCLAKCIRHAVSKGLCSFVSSDHIEKLRLAGLLTKDIRAKERKKFGKEGARRSYTWKKR